MFQLISLLILRLGLGSLKFVTGTDWLTQLRRLTTPRRILTLPSLITAKTSDWFLSVGNFYYPGLTLFCYPGFFLEIGAALTGIVLIHTSGDDPHAHSVATYLRNRQVEVCILSRERCFLDWSVNCQSDEVIITAPQGQWASGDIRSVYWRRDYIVEPAWVQWERVTPQVAKFLAEQRSMHVESAFKRLIPTTPFINNIGINRVCSSKALQHHVARRCSLRVPATYIGSDKQQAEQFARALWDSGRRCCTKNIESSHLEIKGVKHARLTRMFLEENLPELQGLAACPMIFQEYVEKKYEYRVTVVGQEVFACRIDSQAAGGDTAVDWRNYNIPTTPHFATVLEDVLQSKLVKLVHELGLTFGAVDLVENPEGDFYFLEVNSMGQWLWIEDLTELPISDSIARHLEDPKLIRR
jgi:glutathione synthase/RimK-type ligase-like ATP-grasp enzyme